MCPNIAIGDFLFPSWYAMLIVGIVVPLSMAVCLRPADFPITKKAIFFCAILLALSGVLGARLLYIILNKKELTLAALVTLKSGFAYFGAPILALTALFIYSKFKNVHFMRLADYGISFLILSQVFVRIGCLMAGCCAGKPAQFGVIFKTVDKIPRHPTQAYEAILLIVIYILSRILYPKKAAEEGFTLFFCLALYGLGRFFVESLRIDSPMTALNLTVAQIASLSLAVLSIAYLVIRYKKGV